MRRLIATLFLLCSGVVAQDVYKLEDDESLKCAPMPQYITVGGKSVQVGSLKPTVKDKCDTTWTKHEHWDTRGGSFDTYQVVITCVKDTAVVDTTWGSLTFITTDSLRRIDDTAYYRPTPPPLNSSEIATLREMIVEWLAEKKYLQSFPYMPSAGPTITPYIQQVRDSIATAGVR